MTNPATPAANATPSFTSLQKLIFWSVAIALLAWAGHAWLAQHDERVKAEASVASLQTSITQLGADKQDLVDQQKQRDAQTADQIAKITAAAAAVKTPQQIVKYIPQQLARLGSLPAPVQATIAAATADNPSPPAELTIPQADLEPLKQVLSSCQTNAVALPSAQQDVSSCEARAKLSAQQLADAQKQVQALQLELKGGTFWHRVKAGTKKVAIGVAIGAAAGVVLQCKTGHYK
jgi:hypothetical protein